MATTLNRFQGRLDVLVNNASALGSSPMPYLLDYPLEDFRTVLNTNLIAPFLLIKKVLPAMIEQGGSIINVTSDAGVNGYPGWEAYGISKFGIEGMSQTWAAELEDSGVRLNWVDPGDMNNRCNNLTPMFYTTLHDNLHDSLILFNFSNHEPAFLCQNLNGSYSDLLKRMAIPKAVT